MASRPAAASLIPLLRSRLGSAPDSARINGGHAEFLSHDQSSRGAKTAIPQLSNWLPAGRKHEDGPQTLNGPGGSCEPASSPRTGARVSALTELLARARSFAARIVAELRDGLSAGSLESCN